ncbi:MAG: CehA/McbA family metallohydrolase, partial [Clostridia bacterium]
MQQIIDRNIEKREEQTYLDIPFSMPPDTARLDIAYAYTRHRVERITEAATRRREVNIIDLMLEDETGQNVGASGSDRREVYLGCAEAASGYAVQPMRAGTWHLRLGAYKVEEDGCPVRVTLTFTPKRRTLYLGDPHVHSVHSDGTFTVSELAHMARKQGLQYLATTDHNTYLQNAYGAADAPVTLIPGMEWTHYRGHCNFLGVANPVRSIIANSDVRMREILEEARANGALVSLNHPMDRSCPWKFALDAPHAAVEVWNGPNWSHNQDAMAWWVRRIGEGERVAAMGGSDFHQIGFGAT